MVGAQNLAAIGGLLRNLSASFPAGALLGVRGSRQGSLPGQAPSSLGAPAQQQQWQWQGAGAPPKLARGCSAWDGPGGLPAKPEPEP